MTMNHNASNVSLNIYESKNDSKIIGIDGLNIINPTSLPFKVIHVSAIVALAISIIVSIYTLTYLKRSTTESFYKWKIGKFFCIQLKLIICTIYYIL